MSPRDALYIGPQNLNRGIGGVPKEILPFLGVAGGDEQISDHLGNMSLFFLPDTSEMILPGNTGVKILIFAGIVERQPPKVDQIFQNFTQIFETFSMKNRYLPKLGSHAAM